MSQAPAAVPQLDTPKLVDIPITSEKPAPKGFAAKAVKKAKAKPTPQPIEEPTAPVVDNDTQNLADEIAALVGEVDTDDK